MALEGMDFLLLCPILHDQIQLDEKHQVENFYLQWENQCLLQMVQVLCSSV